MSDFSVALLICGSIITIAWIIASSVVRANAAHDKHDETMQQLRHDHDLESSDKRKEVLVHEREVYEAQRRAYEAQQKAKA